MTPEQFTLICERIADGEVLTQICAEEGMPDRGTVRRHCLNHPEDAARCARARAEQADAFAERIKLMADAAYDGKADPKGASVGISALQWLAEKAKPRAYGRQLALTGADGGAISVNMTKDDASLL